MKLEVWAAKLQQEAVDHFAELLELAADPETERADYDSELAARLAAPQRLRLGLGKLRSWTVEVLKIAVCRFAGFPFIQQELEQHAFREGISGAHVKASLAILKRQGFLLGLRKAWGEEVYLIPEDTLGCWQTLLFGEGLAQASENESLYGEAVGNAGCAAYYVLEALRVIEEGIRVTKQGSWPKPMARKLEKMLGLTDEDVAALKLRFRPGIGLGPASGLILDLAVRSGLIDQDGDVWKLRKWAIQEWVSQPLSRVQRNLYWIWRQTAASGEPWEAHFFACLERAEAGRWYYLGSLFEWLGDCDMINRIGSIGLPELVQARLMPMQALGWIRLLELEGGMLLFQIPYALAEDDTLDHDEIYNGMIVQTDMELILPPWPPLALLWTAMEWCIPVSRGEMVVLRLAPDLIRRAAGEGTGPDQIIRFLEQFSRLPLDSSVRHTIESWAGGCKAVIKTEASVILLKDDSSQQLAEECGELRELGMEKLGDGIYVVPSRSSQAVSRVLHRLGLIVAELPVGRMPEPAGEEPKVLDAEPSGLVLPVLQELVYAPAPIAAMTDPNGWEKAPAAWSKTLASYHPSTSKEMIRQAIAWRTPVRLAGEGSGDRLLIPTGIRETDSGWLVEGLQDKTMTAVHSGEWNKIQIIIPGAGD